jgi:hypothetical protein
MRQNSHYAPRPVVRARAIMRRGEDSDFGSLTLWVITGTVVLSWLLSLLPA